MLDSDYLGLNTNPPQKVLEVGQTPSSLIVGENFELPPSVPDGRYILQAEGVDFIGQDVTISTSWLYQVKES